MAQIRSAVGFRLLEVRYARVSQARSLSLVTVHSRVKDEDKPDREKDAFRTCYLLPEICCVPQILFWLSGINNVTSSIYALSSV